MIHILQGLDYGDEGKARVLDKIVEQILKREPAPSVVARWNGGSNAGHTLEFGDQKIALHQVPSGIFHEGMHMYIGSGTVLNPVKLMGELQEISSLGIDISDRFHISGRVGLVLPHHLIQSKGERGRKQSTGNGISEAYSSLAMRRNNGTELRIQFGDYLRDLRWKDVVRENLELLAVHHQIDESIDALVEEFDESMRSLRPYETSNDWMQDQADNGAHIFLEGAQSTKLDTIQAAGGFGTASRTLHAFAPGGADLPLRNDYRNLGVVKAIMSRVGAGPFVSELGGVQSERYCDKLAQEGLGAAYEQDAVHVEKFLRSGDPLLIGQAVRVIGGEYGATTTRPRRVGLPNAVSWASECKKNAIDELYVTKVDMLGIFARTDMSGLPIVVGYELDGREVTHVPETADELYRVKSIVSYELPHIEEDITHARKPKDLPPSALQFVDFVQDHTKTLVYGIGVGPERDQFVFLREPGQ